MEIVLSARRSVKEYAVSRSASSEVRTVFSTVSEPVWRVWMNRTLDAVVGFDAFSRFSPKVPVTV